MSHSDNYIKKSVVNSIIYYMHYTIISNRLLRIHVNTSNHHPLIYLCQYQSNEDGLLLTKTLIT